MELKLLEANGVTRNNVVILNTDEYAYISGSMLIVRFFESTGQKGIQVLSSNKSGFSALDYNFLHNLLAITEEGENSTLKLYSYELDNGFKLHSSFDILDSIEIKCIQISRDAKRILVLTGEPLFQLILFEIKENKV